MWLGGLTNSDRLWFHAIKEYRDAISKLGKENSHDVVINRLVRGMLVDLRIFEEVPSRELVDSVRFTAVIANRLETLFYGLYKEVCFLFPSFLFGGKLTTACSMLNSWRIESPRS